MKKIKCLTILLYVVIFLTFLAGCSMKNNEKRQGELNMQEKNNPISDFEKLRQRKLPEATEKQPAENVVKIYFYEITNLLGTDVIMIDLQNKVAQVNPRTAHFFGETDVAKFEITLTDEDVKKILNILKDGNVPNWDRNYSFGDKEMLEKMGGEGYNWTLLIQYKDGTMEPRSGKGTVESEIQPEGYLTFVKELTEFVESKNDSK